MPLTFLLGGARSGKSSLAVRLAGAAGAPVTVVATAEARDEEMAERIARHRAERPPAWSTLEEPIELAAAVESIAEGTCVVVDCLSLWVSNAIEAGRDADGILAEARRAAGALAARAEPSFGISNEVGLGLVPMGSLGRVYRDILGRVNQVWTAAARRSFLVVAGRALALADAVQLLVATEA